MKEKIKFLLFFVLHIMSTKSQHLSIIGSHLLPTNSDYKVFMSAQNIDENSILNVTFKGSDGYEKIESFDGLKTLFKEVKFELPEAPQAAYKLLVTHLNKLDGTCKEQSVQLMDMSQRPIIFIQTDKPVYSTGDEVKFRVFVLNQSLKPFEHQNMEVIIQDPNDRVFDQFSDIKRSDFGVFEESIKLADSLSLGKWKIQVKVNGYKKSKVFEVQHASDIQIDLDVSKNVAFANKKFQMNILLKNAQQRAFSGTAKIEVRGNFVDDSRESLKMELKPLKVKNGKNQLTIDFEDDLNIQLPGKDMILRFDVTVTDDVTKKSSKVRTDIKMMHKTAHDISFIRNKHFRPGVKFPMKLRVKQLDGRPDNSFNKMTMNIEYHNYDERFRDTKIDRKKLLITLKNGDANVPLSPTVNTRKMILDMEFGGTELTEVIEAMPNFKADELMQVTLVNKSHTIGESILVSVESAVEMPELHMLIIGSQGIVASKDFPEVEGRDVYNFTLELTKDMSPESDVIIYYIKEDTGAIIYDSFPLRLGASLDNSLQITAPETARSNEIIELLISSQDGSKVFITAIDDESSDIDEISRNSLYNELIQYKNLKFQDTSSYEFGKFNAFVMQPLSSPTKCGSSISNAQMYTNLDLDVLQPTKAEVLGRKYFPEVWFRETLDISGDKIQQVKVPNSQTSWKVQGIAMHPEKGFVVASKEPKIDVSVGLTISIYAPSTIRNGEVFQAGFSAFNHFDHTIHASVDVEIKNGYLMDEHVKNKYKMQCKSYTFKQDNQLQRTLVIQAKTSSDISWFHIQATSSRPVEILVKINANGQKDEARKIIEVHEDGKIIGAQNMRLRSDIIGPALEGLDRIFPTQFGLSEYKMNKFTASIIAYKHFRSTEPKLAEDALRRLKVGYQEALFILSSILPKKNPLHVLRVAQIAKNLIDAKELIAVDESSIFECLEYLKQQQNYDGSFPFYQNSSPRRDIGSPIFQGFIHTALAIEPFLMDEEYKKQFQNQVTKSIDFLTNSATSYINDYEKAVVAYVLALNDDLQVSSRLINSIAGHFKKSTAFPKHAPMFVEIASYLIMAKVRVQMNAQEEVNWLLSKRNYFGAYYSPYDTVLALQALYEFEESGGAATFGVSRNDATIPGFNVKAQGMSAGNNEIFINIEASSSVIDIKMTNMVVLEVNLPSGYKYVGYEKNENILNVEHKDDGNLVLIYISAMEYDKSYKMRIKAEKIDKVALLQEVRIKIYDYYRPHIQGLTTYNYDWNAYTCSEISEKEEEDNKSWFG